MKRDYSTLGETNEEKQVAKFQYTLRYHKGETQEEKELAKFQQDLLKKFGLSEGADSLKETDEVK
jgi:hypothetical protein